MRSIALNSLLLIFLCSAGLEAGAPKPSIELYADKSQDGVINRNELIGFLIAERFAQYDRQKDGLTMEEFLRVGGTQATFLAMSQGRNRVWVKDAQNCQSIREQVEKAFNQLARGRKSIPMSEFRKVRASGGARGDFR